MFLKKSGILFGMWNETNERRPVRLDYHWVGLQDDIQDLKQNTVPRIPKGIWQEILNNFKEFFNSDKNSRVIWKTVNFLKEEFLRKTILKNQEFLRTLRQKTTMCAIPPMPHDLIKLDVFA